MSEKTKSNLEKLVLAIGIVTFGWTVLKSAVLLPREVEENRVRIEAVKPDHDLLQRIDERTANMQRDLQDLKRRP